MAISGLKKKILIVLKILFASQCPVFLPGKQQSYFPFGKLLEEYTWVGTE